MAFNRVIFFSPSRPEGEWAACPPSFHPVRAISRCGSPSNHRSDRPGAPAHIEGKFWLRQKIRERATNKRPGGGLISALSQAPPYQKAPRKSRLAPLIDLRIRNCESSCPLRDPPGPPPRKHESRSPCPDRFFPKAPGRSALDAETIVSFPNTSRASYSRKPFAVTSARFLYSRAVFGLESLPRGGRVSVIVAIMGGSRAARNVRGPGLPGRAQRNAA